MTNHHPIRYVPQSSRTKVNGDLLIKKEISWSGDGDDSKTCRWERDMSGWKGHVEEGEGDISSDGEWCRGVLHRWMRWEVKVRANVVAGKLNPQGQKEGFVCDRLQAIERNDVRGRA